MLRHKADFKTIVYIVGISAIWYILFSLPIDLTDPFYVSLWIFQLVAAISVGPMVHNHKHVPMWKSMGMNTLIDCWLTILYGYPVFGWIPTHIQNHHLHTNGEDDYTKTYAYSEKNNLWTILVYPSYSGGIQQKAIFSYLKSLIGKDAIKFCLHLLQIIVFITFMIGVFLIDWQKALLIVVLPQQVALTSVLFFNYIQHIHADESSEWNHSRNVVGPLNFFLFNNGLHTAHHWKPYVHWSRLPDVHREIKHHIDPALNESSLIWYLVRQYMLAPFVPTLGTKSLRAARQELETHAKV